MNKRTVAETILTLEACADLRNGGLRGVTTWTASNYLGYSDDSKVAKLADRAWNEIHAMLSRKYSSDWLMHEIICLEAAAMLRDGWLPLR